MTAVDVQNLLPVLSTKAGAGPWRASTGWCAPPVALSLPGQLKSSSSDVSHLQTPLGNLHTSLV